MVPLGLFVGPLAGVLVGELLGGRGLLPAGRSTLGTFLGTVAGMAGKLAIAILMIGWFLIATLAMSGIFSLVQARFLV